LSSPWVSFISFLSIPIQIIYCISDEMKTKEGNTPPSPPPKSPKKAFNIVTDFPWKSKLRCHPIFMVRGRAKRLNFIKKLELAPLRCKG